MDQAVNWLSVMEDELHEYYGIPAKLRILQDHLNDLEIQITMRYSSKSSQFQRNRTSPTERLAVKRLDLQREITDLEIQQEQMNTLMNQLSPVQQELLLRCYGQKQSLRSTSRAMRISFTEAQVQGYEAMKHIHEFG